MKENTLIFLLYFSIELKITELQHLNDNYKGSAKSYNKLECTKSGILERNFHITKLDRKVKEANQEHSELLLLR